MAFSDKAIEDMANLLKVKPEAIKDAIGSEDEVEFESLGSPVKYVYTEEGYNTLIQNTEKEGYGKGKKAGEEMPFKELKNEKFPESKATNFNELLEEVESENKSASEQLLEQQKNDLSGNVDERIEEERKAKEEALKTVKGLQKAMKAKEEVFDNEKRTWHQDLLNQKTDTQIINAASIFEFEIPKDVEIKGEDSVSNFIETKRNILTTIYKSQYSTEYDETGNPIFVNKSGEKMLDEYKAPRKASDLMGELAKDNYLNLRKDETFGRGDTDSQKHNFSGIRKGMTKADFDKHIKDKGIAPMSTESDPLWAKFLELNPQ